jgi:hypothetical protein
MRPIEIELLPSKRPSVAVASLFFLAGLATATYQWLEVRTLDRQLQAAATRAYLDEAASSKVVAGVPARTGPPAYLEDARTVVAMAAFDWGGHLKALEAIREPGVRVNSATVDAQARSIVIEVELTSASQTKSVLSALNAGQSIDQWRLVRAQSGAAGKPATASIEWTGSR